MKQMSLGESGFERKTKRTSKREFLDEMNLVVPWAELVSLIAARAPTPGAKGGRPPFEVETMLRIQFLQQWFNLSDPAMEEALYDTPMFREFVGLDAGEDNLPDESTILRFRHLLEAHDLSLQILATVNATLAAKGLPRRRKASRDPRHQNPLARGHATGQAQGAGQEHTDGRDPRPAGAGQWKMGSDQNYLIPPS